MKRKEFFRPAMLAMALFVMQNGQAQVSVDQNWPLNPGTDYVGWDNSTTVPLMVRHDNNQPIQWWTEGTQRMQLYYDRTGVLPIFGGGTVNVPQNGYLGLSNTPGFFGANAYGPFSRLHLADDDPGNEGQNHYNQPWGYRTWMRNGVTFTGNHDQAYIGQRYYSHDSTDLVIHWSDNADKSTFGPDHCRFLFTSDPRTGSTRGARSQEGLELMRLLALDSLEGVVGIGDFAQPGLAEPEPTERLDILDRTIRLRRLIPDYNNDTIGRVVVVDVNGRLHWRRINSWPSTGTGTADCKWTLLGTGNANIATAYAGNPGCPQYDRFVGIGTNAPSAKLHVKWTGTAGVAHASQFAIDGSSYGKRGGEFSASGTGSLHAGLRALASGASSSLGVEGNMAVHARAEGTVSVARNRGLFSEALVTGSSTVGANLGLEVVSDCNSNTTVTENYGVRAVARTFGASTINYGGLFSAVADDANATVYGIKASAAGGDAALRWAGWFDGNVKITNTLTVNTTVYTSDQSLKTNIEAAPSCLPIIDALQPKQYRFTQAATDALGVDQEQHVGLIAQELEQVLPTLVHEVVMPAVQDSLGNTMSPSWSYKGVDYVAVIPYLIGAVKELAAQNATMQAQLAACCTQPNTDQRIAPATGLTDNDQLATGEARLLRIAPNPFIDRTTLYCTLERSGRMQLLVNSADGRDLRVLSEAQREAGDYQVEWDTTRMAPGVYYMTLLLDGEPVVKRAVKVGQ